MKVGRDLQSLAAEIVRQQETKRDYLAPAPKLQMNDTGEMVLPMSKDADLVLRVNDLAHRQLGSYTDIPAPYYDLLREKAPALLAQNVNHWLREHPNDVRQVRTLDGRMRAFLSDSYRSLDNADLAQAALPVLQELDVEVISCEITERRLYIKAVDKRIVRQVPVGGGRVVDGKSIAYDEICPVISISNSEVGAGSLSVETGCYTHECKNMMLFRERSLRKYHVGKKHELTEDFSIVLSERTQRLTDAATWAQVGDVVKGAFDQIAFDRQVGKLKALTDQRLEGKTEEVVEIVGKKLGATEGERQSILKHLIEGGNLSRYGLLNAVTRAAEDIENYDRATEFERMGGHIIELPPTEWKEVARLAA